MRTALLKLAFSALALSLSQSTAWAATAAPTAADKAAPYKRGQIVITVDISRQQIWLEKFTPGKKRRHLTAITLPVVKQSLHAGDFRPTHLYSRYRTVNGNTYLENVVFFDGARSLRTTRHFENLQKEGRPVSGAVTLEPDFGSLLFETIRQYGPQQTRIRIR